MASVDSIEIPRLKISGRRISATHHQAFHPSARPFSVQLCQTCQKRMIRPDHSAGLSSVGQTLSLLSQIFVVRHPAVNRFSVQTDLSAPAASAPVQACGSMHQPVQCWHARPGCWNCRAEPRGSARPHHADVRWLRACPVQPVARLSHTCSCQGCNGCLMRWLEDRSRRLR